MMYRNLLRVLLPGLLLAGGGVFPEVFAEERPGLPELTEEQLDRYQFQTRDKSPPARIEELSVGQRFLLGSQRNEMKELLARRLGIMSFKSNKSDLDSLQQLYDRRIIGAEQVKEWQAAGVLFGDIVAAELGLHWVSYVDHLGESKALRFKKTSNFVFPVTVFSKRLQFGEAINVKAIYGEIEAEVIAFKEHEERLGRKAVNRVQ